MSNINIPASYDQINLYNGGISPSTVHCRDTNLQRYFRKYLLQKVMSVFKWTLPKNWDKDYFLYSLYGWGYVAIIKTEKYGVIPQFGTVGGYNVFYHPTYVIVSNPLIPISTYNIGKTCSVIKLQPDYSSVMDLVNYYADMMALCSQSASINLMSTHTGTIFPATDKATAESYKKMFDKVAQGEPAVVTGKTLFDDTGKPMWTPFAQNVKEMYIASDILSDMKKIEARFDTEIGIPNANTDKRERLITDEVNSNNADTGLRGQMWLEELQKGIDDTKNLFDVDISVNWRINPMYEGGNNNGVVDRDGAL